MPLLDERLEAEVVVVGPAQNFAGREYYELNLVSEDNQALHLYEGQLKELADPVLEPGRRYKLVLRPFVNNRWIELKIERLEAL